MSWTIRLISVADMVYLLGCISASAHSHFDHAVRYLVTPY
jgi:hypothetical protein